jgi:hypothetical protein
MEERERGRKRENREHHTSRPNDSGQTERGERERTEDRFSYRAPIFLAQV